MITTTKTSMPIQTQPDLISQYHKDGFIRIPGVLTPEQVSWLRSFALERFNKPSNERYPGDLDPVLFDPWNRYPELRFLLFLEPKVNILKKLLGEDYVILADSAIHRGYFAGWHKDSTNLERAGYRFHYEPDYRMVVTAYYLQDADPVFGGGLDVEPGTHVENHDKFFRAEKPGTIQKLFNKFVPPKTKDPLVKRIHSIPSKAGDLIIFNFRLTHRATPNTAEDRSLAPTKLGIFQTYSANNRHVESYKRFTLGVEQYLYLKNFAWNTQLQQMAANIGVRLG